MCNNVQHGQGYWNILDQNSLNLKLTEKYRWTQTLRLHYKCWISCDYTARTDWGEVCMNIDKCFCFLPLYSKEQPTDFHVKPKCCDLHCVFILLLKLCLGSIVKGYDTGFRFKLVKCDWKKKMELDIFVFIFPWGYLTILNIHGLFSYSLVIFHNHNLFNQNWNTFWTELSCIFVPKSRMVQLWIISVNLVFVKYVNMKDSINRASTAF